MKSDTLFSEFPPISPDRWIEKIKQDLREGSWEELIWKSPDGLELNPFYADADRQNLEYLNATENLVPLPEIPGVPVKQWYTQERLKVNSPSQANEDAIRLLHSGIDDICFELTADPTKEDLEALLHSIDPRYCRISFHITELAHLATRLTHYLQDHAIDPSDFKGTIYFEVPASPEQLIESINKLIPLPGIRIGLESSPPAGNYVKSVADQLGTLSEILELITESSLTAIDLLNHLAIRIHLSNDHFLEIARLKVLRLLISAAFQAFEVEISRNNPVWLEAITTPIVNEETKEDPYLNMLSNTNQAMAAILGDCQVLQVTPFNSGISEVTAFGRRNARNISNLLRDESYFDRVMDPVAGSYYLESLIDQLARASWKQFQTT